MNAFYIKYVLLKNYTYGIIYWKLTISLLILCWLKIVYFNVDEPWLNF